jgi:hypothetical protein
VGFIHAFQVTPGGVIPLIELGSARGYAANYFLFAVFFLFVHVWRKKRGYLSALK